MKIVRIQGGLGNQMFQYALYTGLKKKGIDARIDDSDLVSNGNEHNGAELERAFGLKMDRATSLQVKEMVGDEQGFWFKFNVKFFHKDIRRNLYRELVSGCFEKDVLKDEELYLQGYWQSEKYFEDAKTEVKEVFSFKNVDDRENVSIKECMEKTNGVAVHIRRGDYLKYPDTYGGICDEAYYLRAMDYMEDRILNPVFYVFSDDIQWVKNSQMAKKYDLEIVDINRGKASYKDMFLMSCCKHHIIANSSFSWWGAWLGEKDDSINIAPKKWINNADTPDVCPDRWIRL